MVWKVEAEEEDGTFGCQQWQKKAPSYGCLGFFFK